MGIRLTRRALRVAAAEAHLASRQAGAVVVFAGRVRPDRRGSERVVGLDYEVDLVPALARLRSIERDARRRFSTTDLILWHRLGRVKVGEVSVVAGAGCAHRAEAFRAARYLIDELKATVPIWKEERARPVRRRLRLRARPRRRSSG